MCFHLRGNGPIFGDGWGQCDGSGCILCDTTTLFPLLYNTLTLCEDE